MEPVRVSSHRLLSAVIVRSARANPAVSYLRHIGRPLKVLAGPGSSSRAGFHRRLRCPEPLPSNKATKQKPPHVTISVTWRNFFCNRCERQQIWQKIGRLRRITKPNQAHAHPSGLQSPEVSKSSTKKKGEKVMGTEKRARACRCQHCRNCAAAATTAVVAIDNANDGHARSALEPVEEETHAQLPFPARHGVGVTLPDTAWG
jgi:hypothetical protein